MPNSVATCRSARLAAFSSRSAIAVHVRRQARVLEPRRDAAGALDVSLVERDAATAVVAGTGGVARARLLGGVVVAHRVRRSCRFAVVHVARRGPRCVASCHAAFLPSQTATAR